MGLSGSAWRKAAKWIFASAGIACAILLVGLSVTASLEGLSGPGAWADRANIGDSFGVVNAVVSGLALAAVVVTLRLQSRELALQRAELAMQRESLERSRVELNHSAEASLRMLHVDLIKMSINDATLAAVWPPLEPGASHEKERQFLYANLIFQHVWLGMWMGDHTEEQIQKRLRYIFTSNLMCEYWRAASKARESLVPGTQEYLIASAADLICAEYEAGLGPAPPEQPQQERTH